MRRTPSEEKEEEEEEEESLFKADAVNEEEEGFIQRTKRRQWCNHLEAHDVTEEERLVDSLCDSVFIFVTAYSFLARRSWSVTAV